jgi:hypothetical protein
MHTCHAKGCETEVPPSKFMCGHHWGMLPRAKQRALWAVYVPGQEVSKTPTRAYLAVARSLIDYVEREEAS